MLQHWRSSALCACAVQEPSSGCKEIPNHLWHPYLLQFYIFPRSLNVLWICLLFTVGHYSGSLLSAKDAPDLIETLSQSIESLSSVEAKGISFFKAPLLRLSKPQKTDAFVGKAWDNITCRLQKMKAQAHPGCKQQHLPVQCSRGVVNKTTHSMILDININAFNKVENVASLVRDGQRIRTPCLNLDLAQTIQDLTRQRCQGTASGDARAGQTPRKAGPGGF